MKNLLCLLVALSLSSCTLVDKVTGRNNTEKVSDLNYMQNIENIATEKALSSANTLQPGDELAIIVSGNDLDVVRPFNQNYSSGALIQSTSTPGGNVIPDRQSSVAPTYLIDSNGTIDFPILGELSTVGKTIEDFKELLKQRLSRYIISPTVNVRQTNFKVTVLGEVKNPGEFVIRDGHATIFTALGLAGDMTIYGKRTEVLLVRNNNGMITKERLDMTDGNVINSSSYNLKQGDVIYVPANNTQEKTAKRDPNAGIYISIASIVVTILALVFRR